MSTEQETVTLEFDMQEAVDLEVALMARAEDARSADDRLAARVLQRKVSTKVKERWPGI